MKIRFSILLLIALSLTACETTVDPDGVQHTRFDADAADAIIKTGTGTWQRIDEIQRQRRYENRYPDHPAGPYVSPPGAPYPVAAPVGYPVVY